MTFNLESFEYHVYRHQHEAAARELLTLLSMLDSNLGSLGPDFSASVTAMTVTSHEVDSYLLSRLTSAIMSLFADPGFTPSPLGVKQMLILHRWLSTVFSASPIRNADALLRTFNVQGPNSNDSMEIATQDLAKLCMLYSGDSRIPLNLDALWAADKQLTAGMCLTLLAPRFCGSPDAHQKREVILPWITARLEEIANLDDLPWAILHDAYMHCSYADRPDKHEIKRPINTLVRRKLREWGLEALPAPPPAEGEKPVLLVVLEWFSAQHSIYRTHSRTIEAARERFRIVGVGLKCVDQTGRDIFDSFHEIPDGGGVEGQLRFVSEIARHESAQVLYMPSVGMFPMTIFLANLRLAPLQAYALGHPATTHSDAMDFVVVESDYVGDPACFSEPLLRLPADGMPYRPSAALAEMKLEPQYRERPQIVEIAIAATTMKLNPGFYATLARIAAECGREVRFNFLVGQAIGLVYEQVVNVTRQFLGDKAVVHRHLPYADYMAIIGRCDLFLNPFPFGNTNGIVDTIAAGLVGICKTGREVHEHIDEGLFRRLGLPDWMIAKTNDDYVAAAIRLIRNDVERTDLRQQYSGPENVKTIFEGRPAIFGQLLEKQLKLRWANQASATHVEDAVEISLAE